MPEIVLHAGAFKTATSAVQTALFRHREMLRGEFGIYLPDTFARRLQGVREEDARAHHLLGHAVRRVERGQDDGSGLRAGLDELAAEVRNSGAPTSIVTTELLTRCGPKACEVIRDALRGFDLRVVYSVRRVDEYLESLAKQELKFNDAVQKTQSLGRTPFSGLMHLGHALGDTCVTTLLYGYPSRSTAVVDTLRALGVGEPERIIEDNPMRNPSLTADSLLLRRALHRALPQAVEQRRKGLQSEMVRAAYDFDASLEHSKPLRIYTKAERLALFDQTLDDHRALASRFLDAERTAAFLDRASIEALPDIREPAWSADEVLEFVDATIRFLAERGDSEPRDEGTLAAELARVRKEFRQARRRNGALRAEIEALERQLAARSSDGDEKET